MFLRFRYAGTCDDLTRFTSEGRPESFVSRLGTSLVTYGTDDDAHVRFPGETEDVVSGRDTRVMKIPRNGSRRVRGSWVYRWRGHQRTMATRRESCHTSPSRARRRTAPAPISEVTQGRMLREIDRTLPGTTSLVRGLTLHVYGTNVNTPVHRCCKH
jgi:hypothetical protein